MVRSGTCASCSWMLVCLDTCCKDSCDLSVGLLSVRGKRNWMKSGSSSSVGKFHIILRQQHVNYSWDTQVVGPNIVDIWLWLHEIT